MTLVGAAAVFSPWTPAEDAALRDAYAKGGVYAARQVLPDRSASAIYHRAERTGLKRRRRWTREDDHRLRKLWDGERSLREIAGRLGRTVITTYWRAQKLGLPLGCPAGWEYLSHAAKRTGYFTIQLRQILKAHGVVIRRAVTRPTKPRGRPGAGRVTWVVWPGDVDAAVRAWLETEPVTAAARRLGICGETLARRLTAVGVNKPTSGKAHWRVRPQDVERAMAHHQAWMGLRRQGLLRRHHVGGRYVYAPAAGGPG